MREFRVEKRKGPSRRKKRVKRGKKKREPFYFRLEDFTLFYYQAKEKDGDWSFLLILLFKLFAKERKKVKVEETGQDSG